MILAPLGIGVGANILVWLIPREYLGTRSKVLVGGLAAYGVVYGVAALALMWEGTMRIGFWPAVLTGAVICEILGGAVVALAWRNAEAPPSAGRGNASGSPAAPPAPQNVDSVAQAQRQPKPEKTMTDKPADSAAQRPSVNVGPGGVVSIDHKGGITAGTVNVINTIPDAKIDATILSENAPAGQLFRTEFLLTVDTKIPVAELYLAVKAPSIAGKLDVAPQRTGPSITGHAGVRDGLAFTNLQNAYGRYKVTVLTKKPERLEIVTDRRP